MIKHIFTFLLFIGISYLSIAQKNLVSVPLAEIVDKKKVYIQPGLQGNKNVVQFTNVLTFGLPANFHTGIVLTDLTFNYGSEGDFFPVDSVRPSLNPDLLIHLQKGFKLGENTWLGIGTQSGANIAGRGTDFSSFNYLNAQTKILQDNLILLGAYYGNETFLATREGKFGILVGLEVPINEKIVFAADYTSGNNDRSLINTGFDIKLTDKWAFYIGGVIPAPESGNNFGGALQFRYLSK